MGNSAIVTRCWRLPAPSAAIVELRHEHGHVMSEYQLLCHGEVVHTVKATTLDILELAFTLSYIKCGGSGVREEHEGMVQVHPQGLTGFSYRLWIGTEEVAELNTVTALSPSPSSCARALDVRVDGFELDRGDGGDREPWSC